MNKHFTKNHQIISDSNSITPLGSESWMGLIPHSDMVVEEITISGINNDIKLTGATTPTASDYLKDIPTGLPFLAEIKQIKLTSGGCKMINPY